MRLTNARAPQGSWVRSPAATVFRAVHLQPGNKARRIAELVVAGGGGLSAGVLEIGTSKPSHSLNAVTRESSPAHHPDDRPGETLGLSGPVRARVMGSTGEVPLQPPFSEPST